MSDELIKQKKLIIHACMGDEPHSPQKHFLVCLETNISFVRLVNSALIQIFSVFTHRMAHHSCLYF